LILKFPLIGLMISGMLITTEAVITEIKKDEPAMPPMGGGMPGMM